MANALYPLAVKKFAQGQLAWGGDIRVACVASGYVANLSVDEFYSSCSAYVVGSPVSMTGLSVASDGICDGNDVTFPSLSGNTVTQIVIYKWVTSNSDSPLICYFDSMSGLSFEPNGTDVQLTWDNGDDKIFRL